MGTKKEIIAAGDDLNAGAPCGLGRMRKPSLLTQRVRVKDAQ